MKQVIRHITVFMLVATIFVASTGLSVHHLYCYCKGEMVTSFLRPDEPCEITENQSPKENCCKGVTCSNTDEGKKHDCSDCTSVLVKLDTKYLPTSFDLKLFDFAAPQMVQFPLPEVISFEKNLLHWQQDLPPPPAGKTLLPWIQSYLC
ncbi:MAG: hypothetical protein K9J37_21270 [Saprospiraceae bacterium]|nr:hypothetical protein [Saprospiraceae bacterium]MCF8252452.1 hypothetical protein [Saprospiraceae bacterium]MCF8282319.1 hypothetical protein [Bacteroidales bacterium]MCF8314061.1 hypothetical protein [Saprospiraceae bacterium]MCF8442799.1 hypothetical protein [Saprospiraceae bacterium]